jgi:hypothetical protein
MLSEVLLVTNLLLLMVAFMFGSSRRPWWQIGLLALVICGPLRFAEFWVSGWRYQVALPYHQSLNSEVIVWIVGSLLLFAYVGYALGFLYSCQRQLAAGLSRTANFRAPIVRFRRG